MAIESTIKKGIIVDTTYTIINPATKEKQQEIIDAITTGSSGTPSIEFQSVTSVPTTTETTVLSFTAGTDLKLDAVGGNGTARSEWFIYINTVIKLKRRSSVSDPNIEIPLYGLNMSNGDIIDVKVKHYESSTQDYESEVRYRV